jgi:1,4-alpha-glucan branching enzyme
MKTGTMVDYANRRTLQHAEAFQKLHDGLRGHAVARDFLEKLEAEDNIFTDIDYRVYAQQK